MSDEHWADAPPDPELGAFLDGLIQDVPSAGALDALARSVEAEVAGFDGPDDSGGPDGSGGPDASAGPGGSEGSAGATAAGVSPRAAKLAGGAALVVAGIAAVVFITTPEPRPEETIPAAAVDQAEEDGPATPDEGLQGSTAPAQEQLPASSGDTSETSTSEENTGRRPRGARRSSDDRASVGAADEAPEGTTETPPSPGDEVALLREARAALATDPHRALALTTEHQTRFPAGLFVEEREVIAIDALDALGRDTRPRTARFFRRWPRSAHRAHLEELLGEPVEDN